MKQILLIGAVIFMALAIVGASAFFVNASSESLEEISLKTCGSCDGRCSSTQNCGQSTCQIQSEGSCGCSKRT